MLSTASLRSVTASTVAQAVKSAPGAAVEVPALLTSALVMKNLHRDIGVKQLQRCERVVQTDGRKGEQYCSNHGDVSPGGNVRNTIIEVTES